MLTDDPHSFNLYHLEKLTVVLGVLAVAKKSGSSTMLMELEATDMLESTNKFKVTEIVYRKPPTDGEDGFAIAKGHWSGERKLSLACRWYNDDGIGYPQTYGKPQWMMLPSRFIDLTIGDALAEADQRSVTLTFK